MWHFRYCDVERGCAWCEEWAEVNAWDGIFDELTRLFASEVYGGH